MTRYSRLWTCPFLRLKRDRWHVHVTRREGTRGVDSSSCFRNVISSASCIRYCTCPCRTSWKIPVRIKSSATDCWTDREWNDTIDQGNTREIPWDSVSVCKMNGSWSRIDILSVVKNEGIVEAILTDSQERNHERVGGEKGGRTEGGSRRRTESSDFEAIGQRQYREMT